MECLMDVVAQAVVDAAEKKHKGQGSGSKTLIGGSSRWAHTAKRVIGDQQHQGTPVPQMQQLTAKVPCKCCCAC